MNSSPYSGAPRRAFWKSGVVESHPLSGDSLYTKRFEISENDRVGTAGSCFAQHIAKAMRASGFCVQDVEPPPTGLPNGKHLVFGYGQYSARYSNIYTSRQLLQLLREAFEGARSPDPVWELNSRYFDSMRPAVEPEGHVSADDVLAHREFHLRKVRELFENLDVFIFTLGLTECWMHLKSGWVFPTAPGTIAGSYDPEIFGFKNLSYNEIVSDINESLSIIRKFNKSSDFRVLLTVSPVPLTATYTNDHVLTATTYSKSVLRAAAGSLCDEHKNIAYFPSYEMVTAPWSRGIFFDSNLRTVNGSGVEIIMKTFLQRHQLATRLERPEASTPQQFHMEEVACEEALLEAFAQSQNQAAK